MDKSSQKKREDLLSKLEDKIPKELLSIVPSRWWIVGEILILTIPDSLICYKEIIGEAILQQESKRVRTVLGKVGPTKGITRTPEFIYLAGDMETITIHKELGCKFKIDAAKLTFSPGNLGERTRLIEVSKPNEFIIDMFSCVGNLSLPLAVHKSPKTLIAAEINPVAYEFLSQNIKLNNVEDRMQALFGDNREILTKFEGQADRVLMGYLQIDDLQIRQAIKLCNKNATVHYHEAVPAKEKFRDRSFKRIQTIAQHENRKVKLLLKKRVKKYSPGVDHNVLDVMII